MGTEFQYAINPLAENRKSISFTVGRLDDWDYLKRKTEKGDKQKIDVFINFDDSMDKLNENKNIESIKSTMLIHENIFKHQVSELHRLYSVQKILMNETRNDTSMITENHIPMTLGLDLQKQLDHEQGQLGAQKNAHFARLSDTSITNYRTVDNVERRLHTQTVQNRSIYMSTENNTRDTCNKDGDGDDECDVDLSLGIGGKKKQMKNEGSSSSSSNNQRNNLPHWLCQGLGSNKT